MRSAIVGGSIKLGGEAREWIQVVELGEFRGYNPSKKPIAITDELLERIIASFNRRRNPVVLDYEHQTLTGTEAPAAGWIQQLELRKGAGLWARVQWTERARTQVNGGEYLFTSVVIFFESRDRRSGEELGPTLHSVALTNDPFIDGMEPVAARWVMKWQEEEVMPILDDVRKALGGVPDEQLVVKIEEYKARAEASKGELATLAEALGTEAKSELLVAKARELRARIQEPEQAGVMQLSQDLLKRMQDLERAEAERLVAAYPTRVTPAMRAHCVAMALRDPKGFREFAASLPEIVPGAITPSALPAGQVQQRSDVEVAVWKQLGLTAEDVKKWASQ